MFYWFFGEKYGILFLKKAFVFKSKEKYKHCSNEFSRFSSKEYHIAYPMSVLIKKGKRFNIVS